MAQKGRAGGALFTSQAIGFSLLRVAIATFACGIFATPMRNWRFKRLRPAEVFFTPHCFRTDRSAESFFLASGSLIKLWSAIVVLGLLLSVSHQTNWLKLRLPHSYIYLFVIVGQLWDGWSFAVVARWVLFGLKQRSYAIYSFYAMREDTEFFSRVTDSNSVTHFTQYVNEICIRISVSLLIARGLTAI